MPTNCIRSKAVIDNENFYVTIGKTFVSATIPTENTEDRRTLRLIVDTLCDCISTGLAYLSDQKELCPTCVLHQDSKCAYYVDIIPGTFECDMYEEK